MSAGAGVFRRRRPRVGGRKAEAAAKAAMEIREIAKARHVGDVDDLAFTQCWIGQEPLGFEQTLFEHEAREAVVVLLKERLHEACADPVAAGEVFDVERRIGQLAQDVGAQDIKAGAGEAVSAGMMGFVAIGAQEQHDEVEQMLGHCVLGQGIKRGRVLQGEVVIGVNEFSERGVAAEIAGDLIHGLGRARNQSGAIDEEGAKAAWRDLIDIGAFERSIA